jgi:hypothetical protein
MLAFTIAKSSQMTKEEIQAGLKASYGGFGSGSVILLCHSADGFNRVAFCFR